MSKLKTKVFNTTEQVRAILLNDPNMGLNDAGIYKKILQLKGHKLTLMTASELIRLIYKGDVPKPSSVERVRRKIQEEDDSTRDAIWDLRQVHAGKVKADVKTIKKQIKSKK